MKTFYIAIFFFFLSIRANSQNYSYYFGNIHAHSSFSDGNKDSLTSLLTTPFQDFQFAKNSEHIDFYGISEHNHAGAGMDNVQHFHEGISDAHLASVNNSFIALYGVEWGVISGGGHVIIYGYDSLLGWDAGGYDVFVAQNDYANLWKKVNKQKDAFAYLAHPQTTDYNNLFTTALNLSADSAIIGMAARSGPAFSVDTTYSDPSTGNFITRYNDALKQGYHLGVGLDHDTHYSVFGRSSAGRLVLMAPSLTQSEIYKALRKMRFYSSDDWNTQVNFKVNNQIMGSDIVQTGNPVLSVNISDADLTDATSTIAIYYGVPASGIAPTVLTTVSNSSVLNYTHTIANNTSYYYYAKITQTDGDIIWTSPIWYKKNTASAVIAPSPNFTLPTSLCVGDTLNLADLSTNSPAAWDWTISGAGNFTSSDQNTPFVITNYGLFTVLLTATNAAGSASYSSTFSVNAPPNVSITALDTVLCPGESINLAGSGATSYSWLPTTGLSSSTISNVTASPVVTTTYVLTGASNGCTAKDSIQILVSCVGINALSNDLIKIYPNPTNSLITIDLGALGSENFIEIVDEKGALIFSKLTHDKSQNVDLSKFENGMYTISITTNRQQKISKKITLSKK